MKIETLFISSFGKLRNVKIDVGDKINIVRGENEAGKSTICNFIRFIFYGLAGRAEEKLRYISWQTSSAGGYAVVTDDGKRYRIEREVICTTGIDGKPSLHERNAVFDLDTGAQCFRGQNAGDVFFGVPADVFDSTVYIGQLGDNRVGGRSLAEAAENILFSGSEAVNAKKALKRLDDARVLLLYKNKRGGMIYELEEKRYELELKLQASQKAGGDVIYLEGSCRNLRAKLESAKARLDACSATMDTYEKYSVKKLFIKRREEEAKRRELEALCEKIKAAEAYNGIKVYESEYIERLEDMSKDLAVAAAHYESAKAARAKAERKAADMSEKIDVFKRLGRRSERRDIMVNRIEDDFASAKRLRNFSNGFMVGALVAAVASTAVYFITKSIFAFTGLGVTLLCLIGMLITSAKRNKFNKDMLKNCAVFGCKDYKEFKKLYDMAMQDEPMMNYLEEECVKAADDEVIAEESLDRENAKAVKTLTDAGFGLNARTADSLSEAIAVCRKEKEALEKANILLGEQTKAVNETDDRLRAYDEAYLREALSTEYDVEAMESLDPKALKRDRDFLTGSIGAMTERLALDEKSLAVLLATTVRPTEVSEELESVVHQIDVLNAKYNAYRLAIESIENASGKLRDGISPKISKTASRIMSRLSLGKYENIGVDNEFALSFTDDASTRPADLLSAGTTDIVYIALRLALMDILYTKSRPPLIFDESFSRTDDERLDAALKLIKEFCDEGAQAIVFTCHGREENAMKQVGEYTLFTLRR